MPEERSFKGVWIPKEIWLNKELTLQEKVIIVEIDSLDNDEGCFASNKYFGEFFNLSNARVSQVIKALDEKGYIDISYIKNGKQIIKRIIKIKRPPYPTYYLQDGYLENEIGGIKFSKGGIKDIKEGYLENYKDNNISINNTTNNKNIYIHFGEYKRIKLTQKEYDNLITDYDKAYVDMVIEKLDEYVESNNNKNKYKNFNLVIRKAIRERWYAKVNNTPEWLDKEIKAEEATPEEKENLENLLSEFR